MTDSVLRRSGLDPETGICWNFQNPGERGQWCKCAACRADFRERDLAIFGRCRSGSRWFWAGSLMSKPGSHDHLDATGYADSEDVAMNAAIDAVSRLKSLPWMVAIVKHGHAGYVLKDLNSARRAARPASKARDARTIEYLYETHGDWYDGEYSPPGRHRIIKKTKTRIYFSEPRYYDDNDRIINLHDEEICFLDRAALERGEELWHRRIWHRLSLTPPPPDQAPEPPNLYRLKAEMAAAHPDHGGSNAAFIEARQRYVAAKTR